MFSFSLACLLACRRRPSASRSCAHQGVRLIVYIDACERVSQRYPVSFRQVLGHAMAHEIAHVLLHSSAHSQSGLMLGRWDRIAWQRAAVGGLTLNPSEAARIRLNLLAPPEPSLPDRRTLLATSTH